MELRILENGCLQVDDARIVFRNFSGAPSKFNKEGDRNFSLVIPNEDIADALVNAKNKMGVGWNVKIKEPIEEGDLPLMHLKVKIKFNARGPKVYLKTGDRVNLLDEETVGMLDDIDIDHVNMDIRPYDDEINGKPFRSAYLQSIEVVQNIDRFAARYAEEEFPRE